MLYVLDGRVSVPSKWRLKGAVAAPVVPCGCCVVGLAPAHTAAVWLSVWAAGITGRPFTPAQTAICSPSPSMLVHSASSLLHHSIFCLLQFSAFPPCSRYTRLLSATLYPLYPQSVCLSFCLSLTSSPLLLLLFIYFLFPQHLFLPYNSHRNTNINSSSWELL